MTAPGGIRQPADTGVALPLRDLATHHPLWFALVAGVVLVVLEFAFFLLTPRLLLDLPFRWRDLVPGAAICTVAAEISASPPRSGADAEDRAIGHPGGAA